MVGEIFSLTFNAQILSEQPNDLYHTVSLATISLSQAFRSLYIIAYKSRFVKSFYIFFKQKAINTKMFFLFLYTYNLLHNILHPHSYLYKYYL